MSITELSIQQVKRITAAHINPDGSMVIIGGENAAGKSSVLDSIAYALGGGKLIPEKPLRKGAKKGSVSVTLDDGTVIKRTFTAAGGGGLKVTTKDGTSPKGAQSWLDSRIGSLSFDPTEFLRQKAPKQATVLRDLCGVDTTEMDAKRAKLYAERTNINRDVSRADGAAESAEHYPDAVAVDVDTLLEKQATEQSARDSISSALQTAQRRGDQHGRAVANKANSLTNIDREIEALQTQRKDTEAAADAEIRGLAKAPAELKKTQQEYDRQPEPTDYREAIRDAVEANRQIRANERRERLLTEAADYHKASNQLTYKIDAIDGERDQMLSSATFPLAGLAIDDKGDPTYNGVPLEQASGAEQIRISIMVGLALSPDLRIMLIRDGSLLDASNMELIAKLADENSAQVWVERVGDSDDSAIVIEDGTVRGSQSEMDW